MDGRDNPNKNSSLDNSTPRRAIFSSGDTPTPAEPNLDQSSNSVIGPRLGGVVPSASSSNPLHPTNSADAAYIAAHPVATKSTATGDLVFNKPKKSKKWIIVVLILIIIIASICGIFLLMNYFSASNQLKRAFNEYANFFLYNENSSADLKDLYNYGDRYYLATVQSDEMIQEHFRESEEKYKVFLEQYQKYITKDPNLISDDTKQLIDSYLDKIDLLRFLTLRPVLRMSSIIATYVEDPGQFSNNIDEYYMPFNQSEVSTTRMYGEEYSALIHDFETALRAYTTHNCLKDGRIDIVCQQNTENSSLVNANAIYNDLTVSLLGASTEYSGLWVDVYRNIWNISEGIK